MLTTYGGKVYTLLIYSVITCKKVIFAKPSRGWEFFLTYCDHRKQGCRRS